MIPSQSTMCGLIPYQQMFKEIIQTWGLPIISIWHNSSVNRIFLKSRLQNMAGKVGNFRHALELWYPHSGINLQNFRHASHNQVAVGHSDRYAARLQNMACACPRCTQFDGHVHLISGNTCLTHNISVWSLHTWHKNSWMLHFQHVLPRDISSQQTFQRWPEKCCKA